MRNVVAIQGARMRCVIPLMVRCARSQSDQNPELPPRITSNLKANLKILKKIKELERNGRNTQKPATSYRKRKLEKKESVSNDIDISIDIDETNKDFWVVEPVLLVDGYNLCGYWPKLKKHFARGDLLIVREKLINELITFSLMKGVKVVVAFDAKYSGLPNHKETINSVDVIYTGDATADSWIEREVYLLKADGCENVSVVTSDSLHRDCANGAGAQTLSCKMLISEIKEAKKELELLLLDDKPYSVEGKLLEHNVEQSVYNSLQALKKKLKEELSRRDPQI